MNKMIPALGALIAVAIPAIAASPVDSGLKVGEMVTPYHPKHVAGPDKGTTNCPPCTYGNRPAVQAWFNMDEKTETILAITKHLSGAVDKYEASEFKAFSIMLTKCEKCVEATTSIGGKLGFDNVGFAYVDLKDEAIGNYKINTTKEVMNTILVYKDKKVVAKFVNLGTDAKSMSKLDEAIASITGK